MLNIQNEGIFYCIWFKPYIHSGKSAQQQNINPEKQEAFMEFHFEFDNEQEYADNGKYDT